MSPPTRIVRLRNPYFPHRGFFVFSRPVLPCSTRSACTSTRSRCCRRTLRFWPPTSSRPFRRWPHEPHGAAAFSARGSPRAHAGGLGGHRRDESHAACRRGLWHRALRDCRDRSRLSRAGRRAYPPRPDLAVQGLRARFWIPFAGRPRSATGCGLSLNLVGSWLSCILGELPQSEIEQPSDGSGGARRGAVDRASELCRFWADLGRRKARRRARLFVLQRDVAKVDDR